MRLSETTLARKRPQLSHTDLFGFLMVPAAAPVRYCDNCQRCGATHSTRDEYLACRKEYGEQD